MKNGPEETYNEDGSIQSQHWYKDGVSHREDGPAAIYYYEDGSIHSRHWYINGRRHREDQPAEIWYYKDGSIKSQSWYINGKPHREDGPATIWYCEDGSIHSQHWCANGKYLTKIPQEMLVAYMTSHNLTLAELLLSNDDLIRKNTQGYDWNRKIPK